MTYKETTLLLGKIKDLYPNSKLGDTPQAAETVVKAWHEVLANIDIKTAGSALMCYYGTDTSGFAPQPGHLMAVIRQHSSSKMDDNYIKYHLDRALSNSYYGAEQEFERLPDELKKLVGNAGEIRARSVYSIADNDIWVRMKIKEYREMVSSGTLDNVLLIGTAKAERIEAKP